MCAQPATSPSTDEELPLTSKFCPECGARLPEGAKVCKFCNTVQ